MKTFLGSIKGTNPPPRDGKSWTLMPSIESLLNDSQIACVTAAKVMLIPSLYA